jgi:hypothetical protein
MYTYVTAEKALLDDKFGAAQALAERDALATGLYIYLLYVSLYLTIIYYHNNLCIYISFISTEINIIT